MAIKIALTINGVLVADDFEAFELDAAVEVLEVKEIGGDGRTTIKKVFGAEKLGPLTLVRLIDANNTLDVRFFSFARANMELTISIPNRQGGQDTLVKYTLQHAFISSITTIGNRHGSSAPEERIVVVFDNYSISKPKGG